MNKTVTLIIHGTFARDAVWWRLGSDGQESFADQLEREMSRRGLAGTVWKPALAAGFDYSSFCWSGQNRHSDRVAGAYHLTLSLNEFAKHVQATQNEPLIVNFVAAHSHGGNVVLEAIRHLRSNVRVGRIALLGSPLVTTRPALRIASFIFSAIIIAFFIVSIGFFIADLADLASYHLASKSILPEDFEKKIGILLIPFLIFYALTFWLLGNFLDVAWQLICRVIEPLAWVRGRSRSLVYGPSPSRLESILGGSPILLLSTHDDEADVLLQVGSAPGRLYREYVRTKFSRFGRFLEFFFLRAFMLGTFLKATKMVLEIFALGFPVWRTLVQDFDTVTSTDRPYYPAHLLIQKRLDIRPKASALNVPMSIAMPQKDDGLQSGVAPQRGLYMSVEEITRELKHQIRLRHSAYYDNEEVTAQLSDFLAGAKITQTETTQPAQIKPSPEFWEALLAANVGLWVLSVLVNGRPIPSSHAMAGITGLVVLFGYAVPIALGVNRSLTAFRGRAKPRRRFWLVWTICGLFVLLIAYETRGHPTAFAPITFAPPPTIFAAGWPSSLRSIT